MATLRSFAHFACVAVLATAAAGCSTQRTADDIAMQRAYQHKVAVTGSRIPRKFDPATGEPSAGFQTFTIDGEAARAMIRGR